MGPVDSIVRLLTTATLNGTGLSLDADDVRKLAEVLALQPAKAPELDEDARIKTYAEVITWLIEEFNLRDRLYVTRDSYFCGVQLRQRAADAIEAAASMEDLPVILCGQLPDTDELRRLLDDASVPPAAKRAVRLVLAQQYLPDLSRIRATLTNAASPEANGDSTLQALYRQHLADIAGAAMLRRDAEQAAKEVLTARAEAYANMLSGKLQELRESCRQVLTLAARVIAHEHTLLQAQRAANRLRKTADKKRLVLLDTLVEQLDKTLEALNFQTGEVDGEQT